MAHVTNPYHNVEQRKTSTLTVGRLYNFAVGSRLLRFEHKRWLDGTIQKLKEDRSRLVSLFGMASKTGSAASNYELSKNRMSAVKDYLQQNGVREDQFWVTVSRGEGAATDAGEAENREDSYYRAVEVDVLEATYWTE